ncbi:MAG: PEP-CTERM sorting domain-containing protein [Planctomycetaceae bacterium]|nr:PEP-CTERM sorting domain-containing protein [Planctomycetaceae bacterium]
MSLASMIRTACSASFVAATLVLTCSSPANAIVFSASGASPAAIQATVDSFRAALGANNGVGGSFPDGRREINWDGVPNAFAAPNNLAANFFNVNSPRGVVFSTPGSGFQVSANAASGTPVRFGNLNAAYPAEHQTFSAERLFTALDSNTVQIDFFVPGTNVPASVAGFGAVFTDVEVAGATKYTVFYGDGTNGGQFAIPVAPGGGLSFLGLTEPNRYSRIIIQSGTALPGTSEGRGSLDVAFMDDFIYGEPTAIPEPTTAALLAGALVTMAGVRRRAQG